MPYNTTGEDIKAINICYVLMRVFHIEETTVVMGSVTSAPAAARQAGVEAEAEPHKYAVMKNMMKGAVAEEFR